MKRTFEENVEVTYDDNKSMVDLAWELKNTANTIAREQVIKYWEANKVRSVAKIPYTNEESKESFRLSFIENGIFNFKTVRFLKDKNELRFYGAWDYDPECKTYVEEDELGLINGLLYLADYLVEGRVI